MKFSKAFVASFVALVHLSAANVNAGAAAAGEEAMLRSEKIERNLGSVERMVAKAMRGHSKELMEEESLLHQAARMADQGAESAQKAALLREDEEAIRSEMKKTMARAKAVASASNKQQVSSGVEHLTSAAGIEKESVNQGHAEMDEVHEIKGEVVEAIGEQDPSTAAKVEKLLDVVRSEQGKLVSAEGKDAGALANLAAEVKAHPLKPHKASLVSSTSHVNAHAFSEEAAAGALARFARSETGVANKDRHTYHMMKKIDKQAEEALEAQNPAVAKQVADLLSLAEKQQGDIAMSEHMEAVKEGKLAQKMHNHHHAQEHHNARHTSFSELHVATMAYMHEARARELVHDSEHVVSETEQARAMINRNLKGTSVGAEVGELLREAEGAVHEAARDSRKEITLTRQQDKTFANLAKQLRGMA